MIDERPTQIERANEDMPTVSPSRERGLAIDEGNASADVTALGRSIIDRSGASIGAVFVASIRSPLVEVRQREADIRCRIEDLRMPMKELPKVTVLA